MLQGPSSPSRLGQANYVCVFTANSRGFTPTSTYLIWYLEVTSHGGVSRAHPEAMQLDTRDDAMEVPPVLLSLKKTIG